MDSWLKISTSTDEKENQLKFLNEKKAEIIWELNRLQDIHQNLWIEELYNELTSVPDESFDIISLVRRSVLLCLDWCEFDDEENILLNERLSLFNSWKINFLECELLFFSVNEIKIIISNILDNPSLVKPKVEYLKDYNLDNRYLNNYLTRDKNYQGYYWKINNELNFFLNFNDEQTSILLNSIDTLTLSKALCLCNNDILEKIVNWLSDFAFYYLENEIKNYLWNLSWEIPDFEKILESILILKDKALKLGFVK